MYTKSDITSIVEYGLARGIRVIIEFDIPGHSASWGKGIKKRRRRSFLFGNVLTYISLLGYSNITTYCPSYNANINNIPLNPSVPFTFELLEGLLGEIAPLFPDEYIHLGGDEVLFIFILFYFTFLLFFYSILTPVF